MKKQRQKTKAGRKFISLLLVAAMLLTLQGIPVLGETAGETAEKSAETAAVKAEEAVERTGETREMPKNPVHNCTKEDDGTDTTKWSYVYFGSYPQTEVKGNALTAAITGASYDANGDAWVNGTKYRRMKKSDANCSYSSSNYFPWNGENDYHYFKWERIKWRVLDVNNSTMFVAADKGLDCKDYNEEYTFVTWENCTLRNWLNNDFYGTAFSSGEQGAVVSQTVVNEDNPEYNTEGGNNTTDKVYLLSLSEMMNSDYGFCEDYSTCSVSRKVKVSDYAHARGAWIITSADYAGNCWWLLRSPGDDTDRAAAVDSNGGVYIYGYQVDGRDAACVPALHINLSSDLWSMTDDGTSGEGGDGTIPSESSIQCRSSCTVEAGKNADIIIQAYADSYESLKNITDSITWKSQNTSIATVKSRKFMLSNIGAAAGSGSSGKAWSGISSISVSGLAKGSTVITGTTSDGSVVKCNVTVEETDDSENIGSTSLALGEEASGTAEGGISDFFPNTFSLKRMLIPVDVSKEEEEDGSFKIKGAIGIGRSNWLDNETEWNLYKKNIENIAQASEKVVKLGKLMKEKGSCFAHICEVKKFKRRPELAVMGYFESVYDKNENLISQTGKIAADAKWKGTAEWQFATPIGPLYLNLEGSGKLSAKIGPKYDYQTKTVKIADGSLKFTPSIALESGYGINKIATIGAKGELSAPLTIIPMSKCEVEAKASVHVKLVFVIDYSQELASKKWLIWDTTNRNQKGTAYFKTAAEGSLSEMNTSFAEYESKWNSGKEAGKAIDATGSGRDASVQEKVLQDGILPSSLPVQAEINGNKVLVFQSYDNTRNTLDSSVLKYSVCENGVWSEPQPVWDNGCSDLFADMKVVNNKLVVVWQKEKTEITGDMEQDSQSVLQNIARNSEICFAEFNEDTKMFENQAYVTDNQEYDMMPRILNGSDQIVVSWVRNDAAELMQESGKNTIYTALWNGTSFEEEMPLVQSFGTVDDFVTYQDGTDIKAVYTGEYGEEGERMTAVLNEKNQVIESLSELSRSENSGSVSGMNYVDGKINCISDGVLYSYDPLSGEAAAHLAGEGAFAGTAKYCSNGEKSGYVWSVYDEETDTGSIAASMKGEDGYNEPVTLYEKKGSIFRYVSPVLDESGNWSFLTNTMQTGDGTEEHHSLTYIEKQPEVKTELAIASVNEFNVKNGETGIDYYLKNTGDTPIHNLQMKITLENGSVVTKEIPVTIQPGESVAETVYADLSGVNSAQEVSISIYAKDQADKEDCTVTDSVGLSDVAVTGALKEIGNQAVVTAELSNDSDMDADTTLHLYSDETQTKELCAAQTAVITANGRKQIQMTVNKADIVYNKNDAAYLTLKAVVKDGDYNEDNNVSYVILYKEKQKTDITNAPTAPKPTAIKGKIKAKSRGFLVKWKKQTDVTGYQIQYSTNKKFKKKGTKLKTVSKPSAAKLTVKKLKAGRKYYVRIRTYKTVNGTTYYSDWSKAKTVKVKR